MANYTASRVIVSLAISSVVLCGQSRLALTGATVYPSPEEAPILNGVILVEGTTIVAVGEAAAIEVPPAARSIDCSGLSITAGFWNSHVHLFEKKWADAGELPGSELGNQLTDMFTRFGFTNVFDLGSPGENTRRVRDRINSGEAFGPNIRTTGEVLLARGSMPSPQALSEMGFIGFRGFAVGNARGAAAAAYDLLASGADGVKLHLRPPPAAQSSFPRRGIAAAVKQAHLLEKPVFLHPHDADDVAAALRAGVDVITHTTPSGGDWDRSVLSSLKKNKAALTPTLGLWKYFARRERFSTQQRLVEAAVGQLRNWIAPGGATLFGTDAGAIGYDPIDEYMLMAQAGMTFPQILASLTTTPAELFGDSERLGRIAAGYQADLVVLGGDPASDLAALADVCHTVRAGRIVFSADD